MAALSMVSNFRNRTIDILRKGMRRNCLERVLIAVSRKIPKTRKLVPPVHFYPIKTYRTATRKGVTYRLNLNDPYSHSLYFFNPPDPTDQLLRIIKSHWIAIDVGAYIGTSALRLAAATNSGKVYAYEASLEKFEELEHNIRLNSFKNIIALNKAIGNQTIRQY